MVFSQRRSRECAIPVAPLFGGPYMSSRSETPFDNIESSHEYVSLLAEAIEEALAEVQADISLATSESAQRRRQALQLVHFKLSKLSANLSSSRLLLNDLRTLRRLLLDERSMEVTLRRAAD
jgi:hypothetical protein